MRVFFSFVSYVSMAWFTGKKFTFFYWVLHVMPLLVVKKCLMLWRHLWSVATWEQNPCSEVKSRKPHQEISVLYKGSEVSLPCQWQPADPIDIRLSFKIRFNIIIFKCKLVLQVLSFLQNLKTKTLHLIISVLNAL